MSKYGEDKELKEEENKENYDFLCHWLEDTNQWSNEWNQSEHVKKPKPH